MFWFSYKTVTLNGVVIYEEKHISPAMLITKEPVFQECHVALMFEKKQQSLHRFLQEHFDILLPCFYAHTSHLFAWNEKTLKYQQDRIEHVIAPTRFTVEFKDEFATINTFRP